MKSFGEWFGDQGRAPAAPVADDEEDLPDGLYMAGGKLEAKCCCCEEYKEYFGEVSEFDINNHYCGGSPACCP